ncbi:hypothetical protein AUP68_02506 [Ilyonectria robusta]
MKGTPRHLAIKHLPQRDAILKTLGYYHNQEKLFDCMWPHVQTSKTGLKRWSHREDKAERKKIAATLLRHQGALLWPEIPSDQPSSQKLQYPNDSNK